MTIMDDLLTAEGPIASVYLRAPSETADAEYRLDTRWKNARRALLEADAPADVLDALDGAVAGVAHDDAAAFAVFAAPGGSAVAEPLDDALRHDLLAHPRQSLFNGLAARVGDPLDDHRLQQPPLVGERAHRHRQL